MKKAKNIILQTISVIIYLCIVISMYLVHIDYQNALLLAFLSVMIHVIHLQYKLFKMGKNAVVMMKNQVVLTDSINSITTGGRNIRNKMKQIDKNTLSKN